MQDFYLSQSVSHCGLVVLLQYGSEYSSQLCRVLIPCVAVVMASVSGLVWSLTVMSQVDVMFLSVSSVWLKLSWRWINVFNFFTLDKLTWKSRPRLPVQFVMWSNTQRLEERLFWCSGSPAETNSQETSAPLITCIKYHNRLPLLVGLMMCLLLLCLPAAALLSCDHQPPPG